MRQLEGEWRGKGRSVVSWYHQDIELTLIFKADGQVEGQVGDALLHQARLRDTPNFITRLLNPGSNRCRIGADLMGPLVAKEAIIRKQITIRFSLQEHQLIGGFTTSGSKFGGKESMQLTVYKMILTRSSHGSKGGNNS